MAETKSRFGGTGRVDFRIGTAGFTVYTDTQDPTAFSPTPSTQGFKDGDLYIRRDPANLEWWSYQGGTWIPLADTTPPVFITSLFGRIGDVVSQASDYDANQIDYDGSSSGLVATNVQDAIDQVDAKVDAFGGPYLELAGDTMDATADITLNGGQIRADDGTMGDPAYTFHTTSVTGMYWDSGELKFSFAANDVSTIDSIGIWKVETPSYEAPLVPGTPGQINYIPNKRYVDDAVASIPAISYNDRRDIHFDIRTFTENSEMLTAFTVTRPMTLVAGVVNAEGRAYASSPATTSDQVFDIILNWEYDIGTITFPVGSNIGTIHLSVTWVLNPGDVISIRSPTYPYCGATGGGPCPDDRGPIWNVPNPGGGTNGLDGIAMEGFYQGAALGDVWVSNGFPNNLLHRIDGQTGVVKQTIDVNWAGNNPRGLVWAPSFLGDTLWVSHYGGSKVYKYYARLGVPVPSLFGGGVHTVTTPWNIAGGYQNHSDPYNRPEFVWVDKDNGNSILGFTPAQNLSSPAAYSIFTQTVSPGGLIVSKQTGNVFVSGFGSTRNGETQFFDFRNSFLLSSPTLQVVGLNHNIRAFSEGKDGFIYGFSTDQKTVRKYDPVTGTHVQTFNVPIPSIGPADPLWPKAFGTQRGEVLCDDCGEFWLGNRKWNPLTNAEPTIIGGIWLNGSQFSKSNVQNPDSGWVYDIRHGRYSVYAVNETAPGVPCPSPDYSLQGVSINLPACPADETPCVLDPDSYNFYSQCNDVSGEGAPMAHETFAEAQARIFSCHPALATVDNTYTCDDRFGTYTWTSGTDVGIIRDNLEKTGNLCVDPLFVAMRTGLDVLTSPDGKNWTLHAGQGSPTGNWNGQWPILYDPSSLFWAWGSQGPNPSRSEDLYGDDWVNWFPSATDIGSMVRTSTGTIMGADDSNGNVYHVSPDTNSTTVKTALPAGIGHLVTDGARVYAHALGSVYYSDDEGTTWVLVTSTGRGSYTTITNLWWDTDSNGLYGTMIHSGNSDVDVFFIPKTDLLAGSWVQQGLGLTGLGSSNGVYESGLGKVMLTDGAFSQYYWGEAGSWALHSHPGGVAEAVVFAQELGVWILAAGNQVYWSKNPGTGFAGWTLATGPWSGSTVVGLGYAGRSQRY